jgi:predicted ArsR family transcriptional regulator
MSTDFVAEQLGWLDAILTHPENRTLFEAENQLAIENELSTRWVQENRLVLLNELAATFGESDVFAVLEKIIYANCKRNWAENGREGDNSLNQFIKILWEPLRDMGFEYSIEKEGNKTQFRVTRCPMADFAKKAGVKKWFYRLLCLTDEPSVVGFNSSVTFSRTRTLMEGAAYCDHCYTEHSS